jgi:MYXO-CTERM domain-containing protein
VVVCRPAHHTPGLDFMGTTPASCQPIAYALAALILVAAAYWRRRQSLGYA